MPSNPKLFEQTRERLAVGADLETVFRTDVTLRDLFAAFCAAGLNANATYDMDAEQLARSAYSDADALLARREAPDAE